MTALDGKFEEQGPELDPLSPREQAGQDRDVTEDSAELNGLKELVQVAASGPVAEMTPFGVLVTIFIPWTRVSSMLNDEPKE